MYKYFILICLLFSCNTLKDDKDQIRLFFTKNSVELSKLVERIISVSIKVSDKSRLTEIFLASKMEKDSLNFDVSSKSFLNEIKLIRQKCEVLNIKVSLISDKSIEFDLLEKTNFSIFYLFEDNTPEFEDNCNEEYFFAPCSFKIIKHWHGKIERREHGISLRPSNHKILLSYLCYP